MICLRNISINTLHKGDDNDDDDDDNNNNNNNNNNKLSKIKHNTSKDAHKSLTDLSATRPIMHYIGATHS